MAFRRLHTGCGSGWKNPGLSRSLNPTLLSSRPPPPFPHTLGGRRETERGREERERESEYGGCRGRGEPEEWGGEGGEGGREDKGREGEGRGVKKGEGGPPVPTGNTETIIFHTPANQQHPCRQASRAVGSADSINQSMSPCAALQVRVWDTICVTRIRSGVWRGQVITYRGVRRASDNS